ncbi:hypothetical protein BJ508DRAFT_345397 [Ascobolus immersus RN42]|uniref:Uncharacterized protein n=1 Tax=Ascobolus immersus RN42 TaxID=1160509 RepID=A0A3N4H960_ASCIM|nr:hypothetical protein BJ508DRAFT_345397 [Ascobolus immersus RN42]
MSNRPEHKIIGSPLSNVRSQSSESSRRRGLLPSELLNGEGSVGYFFTDNVQEYIAISGADRYLRETLGGMMQVRTYVENHFSHMAYILSNGEGLRLDPLTTDELRKFPNCELACSWRSKSENQLTTAQKEFRIFLLGYPVSLDSSVDTPPDGDPCVSMRNKIRNYSYAADHRYQLLILLCARQFTPPPLYYRKQFATEADCKAWLDLTGTLLGLLREVIDSDQNYLVSFADHLRWFMPFSAIQGHDLGLRSNSPATLMDLALGCHIVSPNQAARLVWERFYRKESTLITLEDLGTWVFGTGKFGFCNQEGSLVDVARLLIDIATVMVEEKGGDIMIELKEFPGFVAKEIFEGIKDRLRQYKDFFYRFPYKELPLTEAVDFVLSLFYDNPDLVLKEQKAMDLLDTLFKGNDFQGGELHFLPTLIRHGANPLVLQNMDDQGLRRYLLHQLMVYRSPDAVRLLLEAELPDGDAQDPNETVPGDYDCPPLTYIMKQALRNRERLRRELSDGDFRRIAESIRVMVQGCGEGDMRRAADPSLLDESFDLIGFNLNALDYATLNKDLMPFLKALLETDNEGNYWPVSDENLEEFYGDERYLRGRWCFGEEGWTMVYGYVTSKEDIYKALDLEAGSSETAFPTLGYASLMVPIPDQYPRSYTDVIKEHDLVAPDDPEVLEKIAFFSPSPRSNLEGFARGQR